MEKAVVLLDLLFCQTVTPLNEECGLLEWVINTCGLRPILLKLYKERGLYMSGKELKALQLLPNAPLEYASILTFYLLICYKSS